MFSPTRNVRPGTKNCSLFFSLISGKRASDLAALKDAMGFVGFSWYCEGWKICAKVFRSSSEPKRELKATPWRTLFLNFVPVSKIIQAFPQFF